ncbi:MAG: GNAT family N-acetyltransferase [Pseudomonadota bacterium]
MALFAQSKKTSSLPFYFKSLEDSSGCSSTLPKSEALMNEEVLTGAESICALAAGYLPGSVALRLMGNADEEFLQTLYAENYTATYGQDHFLQAYSEEDKKNILHQRYKQHKQRNQVNYPDAYPLMICRQGLPIGKLSLCERSEKIELVELSLLPTWQRRGVGTAMMHCIMQRASALKLPITVRVAPANLAYRFYLKWGFEVVANTGLYLEMRCAVK